MGVEKNINAFRVYMIKCIHIPRPTDINNK